MNKQNTPTAEAMPGRAIGNSSGMANNPSQTSRCRLLSPTVSASVPPIDAMCDSAIRSTVERRLCLSVFGVLGNGVGRRGTVIQSEDELKLVPKKGWLPRMAKKHPNCALLSNLEKADSLERQHRKNLNNR